MENTCEKESGCGNVNGSSDQHEEASLSTSSGGRKHFSRHTAQQIQRLEGFFKECPHPNEDQRQQLSGELGLETKQIKFWFQNKRSQMKALNERAEIDLLRQENEKLRCEKLAMVEALKNAPCLNCKRSPDQEEEGLLQLEKLKLKLENEELRKKIAGLQHFLENGHLPGNSLGNGLQEIFEKTMIETAAKAMEEMLELLRTDEPLWMRCPSDPERFTIHRESYNKRFPKANPLKSSSSRFESSKDSAEVQMNAAELVKLFMHPIDWVDLFPTIVTKANTLRILDSEQLGGSLHVMYEQMHIFSSLVAPREFAFLRYCIKCDPSSWVIVDVSYDCCRQVNEAGPTRCWKLPSGCKIENIPNGNSQVTWVEHVEVDNRTKTHCLFGDLVCTTQTYGAKVWLANLQRTCERILYSSGLSHLHQHELEEVINIPEGRRSTMKLANKMVKNFCEMLTTLDKVNSPQLREPNNSGVLVSMGYGGNKPGQPADGMIISGAASFWLPLSCSTLFTFFTQEDMRPQWDVLFKGNNVNEAAHISCGHHPWNCISIFRPFIPNQQDAMLIFQESGIDAFGAYVIYSPIGEQTFSMAVRGKDTSHIYLQPSGITISSSDDNKFNNCSTAVGPSLQHHSLVTVALQVLICDDNPTDQHRLDFEKTMTTFLDSTIRNIKVALDH